MGELKQNSNRKSWFSSRSIETKSCSAVKSQVVSIYNFRLKFKSYDFDNVTDTKQFMDCFITILSALISSELLTSVGFKDIYLISATL
jgi:hypothetical protein